MTENHEVTKCSLLLSCCGNSSVERQHEAKLRELEDLLADDEEFEGVCEGMLKIRTRNNIKAAINFMNLHVCIPYHAITSDTRKRYAT